MITKLEKSRAHRSSLFAWLEAFIRRVEMAFADRANTARKRQSLARLQSLSDRQLADIGLCKQDVERALQCRCAMQARLMLDRARRMRSRREQLYRET